METDTPTPIQLHVPGKPHSLGQGTFLLSIWQTATGRRLFLLCVTHWVPSGWPGFHQDSKETFIRKNQSWCHQAWWRETCFLSTFVAPLLLGTTALPRNPSGGDRPLDLSLQRWRWLRVRGFRSRSPWRCEWSQSQNQFLPLHSFPQNFWPLR